MDSHSDEPTAEGEHEMSRPATKPEQIRQGIIIGGPFIPESMEVLAVIPFGLSLKVIGRGIKTGQSYDPVLSPEQIGQLTVTGESEPFDGSAQLFRIGVEAHRLGLAYEYDPYFSLSIARVDPLPHQLEAVYEYFLKLPRIRFLLADDPGAGKTIMAGLAPEGAEGPGARPTHPHRHAGEPHLSVATRAEGQVPREL